MSAAEIVVQRQLEAYNARDLDGFVACYHPEVVLFRPPTVEPALVGRAALREFYRTQRFVHDRLHATLVHRAVLGQRVIDHERIAGLPTGPLEVVVAYDVIDAQIVRTWSFAAA